MGFLSGIISAGVQQNIANDNLALQKENLEYQKQLQKEIFAREDNAVQRRAEDLEAAGLSKTLAAGSAANAGQAIHTNAPQMDLSWAQQIGKIDSLLNVVSNFNSAVKGVRENALLGDSVALSARDRSIYEASEFSSMPTKAVDKYAIYNQGINWAKDLWNTLFPPKDPDSDGDSKFSNIFKSLGNPLDNEFFSNFSLQSMFNPLVEKGADFVDSVSKSIDDLLEEAGVKKVKRDKTPQGTPGYAGGGYSEGGGRSWGYDGTRYDYVPEYNGGRGW